MEEENLSKLENHYSNLHSSKLKPKNYFEITLAICFLLWGIYIGISHEFTLITRSGPFLIIPPGTYFLAGSVFSLSGLLLLSTLSGQRFKKTCGALFVIFLVLFIFGSTFTEN